MNLGLSLALSEFSGPDRHLQPHIPLLTLRA